MTFTDNRHVTTELERLIMALSAASQCDAANLLGVRQSALSDCTRRGGRVTGKLLEKALLAGISREWMQEGKLPMRNASAATPPPLPQSVKPAP